MSISVVATGLVAEDVSQLLGEAARVVFVLGPFEDSRLFFLKNGHPGRLDPHAGRTEVVLDGPIDPFHHELPGHLHPNVPMDSLEDPCLQILSMAHDLARVRQP
jgi:hypothetical protein